MLDQRLIRENPSLVEKKLSTRGKNVDLSQIHELTIESKELDIELCNLQSESKKLSKLVGSMINNLEDKNSKQIIELKIKGTNTNTKSLNMKKKKNLDNQIKSEILRLPNFQVIILL